MVQIAIAIGAVVGLIVGGFSVMLLADTHGLLRTNLSLRRRVEFVGRVAGAVSVGLFFLLLLWPRA